jgi:alkylhydroperoxidase family enzyme
MKAVYASARGQGLTDEMIRALPNFENSDLFTPAEKAVLQFTEYMATDHRTAPWDEVRARLGKYYSQAQIMAIGWRAAIFIGYGRLVFFTGLESVGAPCPVSFGPKSGTAG